MSNWTPHFRWLVITVVMLVAVLSLMSPAWGQARAAPDPGTPGDKAMPLPKRDGGVAKDNRSVVKKAKRAGKRTVERARHGTSGIDSAPAVAPAPSR